jgi:hypothetical protein
VFLWGNPFYNDLFHHSNDTLDPDTSSSSTYDLLRYTQSITQGKLSSPKVFLSTFYTKRIVNTLAVTGPS